MISNDVGFLVRRDHDSGGLRASTRDTKLHLTDVDHVFVLVLLEAQTRYICVSDAQVTFERHLT